MYKADIGWIIGAKIDDVSTEGASELGICRWWLFSFFDKYWPESSSILLLKTKEPQTLNLTPITAPSWARLWWTWCFQHGWLSFWFNVPAGCLHSRIGGTLQTSMRGWRCCITSDQSWALSVFFNFFNSKKRFSAFLSS